MMGFLKEPIARYLCYLAVHMHERAHTHMHVHVEVKGQLSGAGFPLPPCTYKGSTRIAGLAV